jgi:ubiquitin C-terminal hydrolase
MNTLSIKHFDVLSEKELNNVATKSDIKEIKSEIKELRAEIQATKFDLLKWMIGIGIIGVITTSSVTFTLIKLIH